MPPVWRKEPVSYLSCRGEQLGQVTRDTEELNTNVLSTRALTEQFHMFKRKRCKHIRYILVSLFPLVCSLSSDWWLALWCFLVMLFMYLSPTRRFTGDPNATVGKAGCLTFHWLCWLIIRPYSFIPISITQSVNPWAVHNAVKSGFECVNL